LKKILSLAIAILFVSFTLAAFADVDVPANLQAALFYKIFDFDENLTETSGPEIVVGIFYNPGNPRSEQAKDEIKENFSILSGKEISGKSVVIKEIASLEQLRDIDIVYVTLGNDASIDEIVKICHAYKILGITDVAEYAQKGLAIALRLEDQKPKIIINKNSAEQSGAKLSSKILSLAEII
jgi:YfiR/HmsC-like